MKHLLIITISVFFVHLALGQTVSPDSLKNYQGKTVTVCSKVASTFVTLSKTTLVNFGHDDPNQTFSLHIFVGDLPKFSYVPAEFLKGKTVCITGEVASYKGKPAITVKSEDQIKVQ